MVSGKLHRTPAHLPGIPAYWRAASANSDRRRRRESPFPGPELIPGLVYFRRLLQVGRRPAPRERRRAFVGVQPPERGGASQGVAGFDAAIDFLIVVAVE